MEGQTMVTRNGTWAPCAVDKVEGFIFANILPRWMESLVNFDSNTFSTQLIFIYHLLTRQTTMGDKSVETLGSQIRFLSVFVTFPPPPPSPQNNVDFSISSTAQTTAPT